MTLIVCLTVAVTAYLVFILALCRSAGRADRQFERAFREWREERER